jgi:acyl-coenzyme A synthetase/AMP-(fatty) acid ligase
VIVAALELVDPQPFLILEHHARRRPSAIAQSTIDRDFTYAELHDYAVSIAGLLRRRGIRPGHVVAVSLRAELNLLFLEAVYHEAAIFGARSEPISERDSVGFDWLISHEASDSFNVDRTIVVDEAFMTEVAAARHHDAPLLYDGLDSVCRISFSSGTTGLPLAVPSTVERQARPTVAWLDSRPFFTLIKGFAGSGVKAASDSLFHGDTYICPGEPDDNITLAQRNFVATLQGSPAQLAEFLDLLALREDKTTSIATVQYIGSFLSKQLLERIRDELGASVTACYGSSEVGMIAVRHDVRDNPANVGTPLAHVTVEIVDSDGQTLPSGTDGIIRVRTTRRNAVYFRPGPGTGNALRDDWFYPGDLGHLDETGDLVLAGRASEVINAGGVKFNAALLDGVLTTLSGVHDGAIIPFESTDGTSSYAALVVVDDEFDLGSVVEPLREACDATPAAVLRIDRIDREQNGKVLRVALAERVQALLAARRDH